MVAAPPSYLGSAMRSLLRTVSLRLEAARRGAGCALVLRTKRSTERPACESAPPRAKQHCGHDRSLAWKAIAVLHGARRWPSSPGAASGRLHRLARARAADGSLRKRSGVV